MEPPVNNDFTAALAAGQMIANARQPLYDPDGLRSVATHISGTPYVVLPSAAKVYDLEELLPRPARKRGSVTVSRPESFIDYLAVHASDGDSLIYAEIDSEASHLALTCVLNDHAADLQNWRDHRCHFAPRLSVEWKRWTAKDRQRMPQLDFAAWLEENRGDIASVDGMPTGAQILEMALNFEAAADKRLRSSASLRSGCQTLEFVDRENDATRTRMEVFDQFTLGIPVFYGAPDAYPIVARLRYRNNSGVLAFWYELIRPDNIFQLAADEILADISEKSGITLLHGSPEK